MSHGNGESGPDGAGSVSAAPADKKVVTLGWADIDHLCRKLAEQIRKSGFVPDIVVGIQRGGCVPAVFLAHLLEVPEFCAFGIRTTASNAVRASRETPRVTGAAVLSAVSNKQVLIVDDVTNTGTTLRVAKEEVRGLNPVRCRAAVIVWDGDSSAGCEADFFARYTPGWVTFPWEV